jgi:hypothetical protein
VSGDPAECRTPEGEAQGPQLPALARSWAPGQGLLSLGVAKAVTMSLGSGGLLGAVGWGLLGSHGPAPPTVSPAPQVTCF